MLYSRTPTANGLGATLPRVGPQAPFITAESWGAVATHLAKAETSGSDPAGLLRTAVGRREFDTADDQSAVLAWRLEKLV